MRILAFCLFCFLFSQIESQAQSAPENVQAGSVSSVLPSPLLSPPFPGSEWDGGPVLGAETDETYYPLQKFLGLDRNQNRIKAYGWIDVSGNLSSSKNSNVPESYDLLPNSVALDQLILRFQRDPNTAQRESLDWGFLVDNIYGTDYRYTSAKGYFSNQLLLHNNIYGADPTQIYGLIYIPQVAQGMLIKIGRFISPSDIEAQWAPQNYIYSH